MPRLLPALLAAVSLLLPFAWPAPAALGIILPGRTVNAAIMAAAGAGWRPLRVLRLAGRPFLLLARGPGASRPPGIWLLPAPLGATCGTRAAPSLETGAP